MSQSHLQNISEMKILQINDKTLLRYKLPQFISATLLSSCMVFNSNVASAAVITTDPALALAIETQTIILKNEYEKRKKHREKIEILQGGIAAGLAEIHKVEDMVLEYMGNASGVLTNMIQLKNIGEYAISITNELTGMIKDIPDNPKGAAITAVCHQQMTNTLADITGMSDLVTRLVTTKYSLKDAKSEENKKHVNLLTAAERYEILVSVEQKMMKIYHDLMLIHYFIRTLGWRDLWFQLDRESYINAIRMNVDVNMIINKWNKVKK